MCEHSDHAPENCPKMSKAAMHDFSATSEAGLPERAADRKRNSYRPPKGRKR